MRDINQRLKSAIDTNNAVAGEHTPDDLTVEELISGSKDSDLPISPGILSIAEQLGVDGEELLATVMAYYHPMARQMPKLMVASLETGFMEGYLARAREESELKEHEDG